MLDANVLYGIIPADLLVTLSIAGAYRAHWSERILYEAERNIINNRPDLERALVRRRFDLMRTALPDASVDPGHDLVDAMTNHPDDRHVLATAVTAGADTIITANTRHFPLAACEPHGIRVCTFDEFLGDLIDADPEAVVGAIEEMAGRRRRPPNTIDALTEVLAHYAPTAATRLRP